MRPAEVRPLAALAVCALVVTPLAAREQGEAREFGAWMAGCDNARQCRIIGLPPGGANGFSLRIDRGAGAHDGPRLFVSIDNDMQARGAGTVSFASEAGTFLQVAIGTAARLADDKYELREPADVAAVLDALRTRQTLTITFHPRPGRSEADFPDITLEGAPAALAWIDERQKRTGTVTALAKPGSEPAEAVPAPPDPPAAAPPRPFGETSAAELPVPVREAVMARFRTELGQICDVDDDPDDAAEGLFTVRDLHAGLLLVGVRCWAGAYNLSRAYYLAGTGPAGSVEPARFSRPEDTRPGSTPVPDNILTNVEFDAERGTVRHASWGRGLGDCGEAGSWKWDGAGFHLLSLEVMPACAGLLPPDWLVLHRTR